MMTKPEIKTRRADYLKQYPHCQYSAAMSGVKTFYLHPAFPGLHIEHIWNRKSARYSEINSNYATVCPVAHEWKHANSVEARIAITWYKHKLAKETGDFDLHFDREALRECAGFDIVGWIEVKLEQSWMGQLTEELPEWAVEMGLDFLEAVG